MDGFSGGVGVNIGFPGLPTADDIDKLFIKYNDLVFKVKKSHVFQISGVLEQLYWKQSTPNSFVNVLDLSSHHDLGELGFCCLIDFFQDSRYARFAEWSSRDKKDFAWDAPPKDGEAATVEQLGAYIENEFLPWLTGAVPRDSKQQTTDPLFETYYRTVDFRGNDLSSKFHAQMFAAGHRYGIGSLMKYAKDIYIASITKTPRWYTRELVDSIYTVYTSTPDSNQQLRIVVAGMFFRKVKEVLYTEKLRDIAMQVPTFGADILRFLLAMDDGKTGK